MGPLNDSILGLIRFAIIGIWLNAAITPPDFSTEKHLIWLPELSPSFLTTATYFPVLQHGRAVYNNSPLAPPHAENCRSCLLVDKQTHLRFFIVLKKCQQNTDTSHLQITAQSQVLLAIWFSLFYFGDDTLSSGCVMILRSSCMPLTGTSVKPITISSPFDLCCL